MQDTPSIFRLNRTPGPAPGIPIHSRNWAQPRDKPSFAKPCADTPKPTKDGPTGADRSVVEADAERFLHHAKGASSQPIGSADWLKRTGLNIRRASDAQHLEAIALAYATYVRINASPLKAAIVSELEAMSGRKRSRTTTDLHLVVERFVAYGGESPAERLAARKLVSRDVRAIRHLEAASVLPSRVGALAATPGEGLHAWARQSAVTRRATTLPTAIQTKRQARAEARQRALIHEVTVTTRRPDGTQKARRRFRLTGLLGSDTAALRARLNGLERQSEREA